MERFTHRARDPRILLGITLILGGGIIGAILTEDPQTVHVARATTEIAAGSPLTMASFTMVDVPKDLANGYVQDPKELAHGRAQHSLTAGELLRVSSVSKDTSDVVLALPLLLPVSTELHTGDQVALWRVPHNKDVPASALDTTAIFVAIHDAGTFGDGKDIVDVRISPSNVPSFMNALAQGDGFVMLEDGRTP